MSSVIQLKVLGSTPPARAAVIVAKSGNRMLLRTTADIAPGALIEAHAGDCVILGEVTQTRVLDDGLEVSVEAHHSFNGSWEPHPAWRGGAEPESVLDSLLALNRQLEELAPTRPETAPASAQREAARPVEAPRARS